MSHETRCTVLMYHYVRNMDGSKYPKVHGLQGLCISLRDFRGQLEYVSRNFKVITLSDYVEFLDTGARIPEASCVLTFDDGMKDHYVSVFPILKERGIRASFFPLTLPLTDHIVPLVHKSHLLLGELGSTALAREFNRALRAQFPEIAPRFTVDSRFKKEEKYKWDDNLTANLKYSIATLPLGAKKKILDEIFADRFSEQKDICLSMYMSGEEMKEMQEAGMDFGGHSHTHPMLSLLGAKEQAHEIAESKRVLEGLLGFRMKHFSYPYGGYNKSTIRILGDLGIECAVTTDYGINWGSRIDPLRLKRLDTAELPFSAM